MQKTRCTSHVQRVFFLCDVMRAGHSSSVASNRERRRQLVGACVDGADIPYDGVRRPAAQPTFELLHRSGFPFRFRFNRTVCAVPYPPTDPRLSSEARDPRAKADALDVSVYDPVLSHR